VTHSLGVTASLAGRILRIEAASDAVLGAIMPAIGHLAGTFPVDDSQVRWTIIEEKAGWRLDAFGAAGAYRIRGGGFAIVQNDPPACEAYDPKSGIELRAGREALAAGDFRAHPGCYGLAAWLAGPRSQILHAGAVAYDGAAALIVGGSGVGKSTTVLACAMAGAGFLGDDLVLVEAGEENGAAQPRVHCLYATAKLNDDSAVALGARAWPLLGVTPKDKAVIALQPPLKIVRSAPLVSLIVLAPPVSGQPHPQPLKPSQTLTSLASTAAPVVCRTGAPAAWLGLAAALARRLPAYRLPVSWTFEALEAAIRAIVTHAAAHRATARRDAS
jgi:hypothetical protein